MTLNIEKTSLVKNIQKEFNLVFPYLKIELFKTPVYPSIEPKPIAEKKSGAVPISSGEIFTKSTRIDIDGQRTVFQLEQDFNKMLGLSVKLFRKSGNMWIQTTLTNNWSLKKQNEEGEFMSFPVVRKDLLQADTEDSWMEHE